MITDFICAILGIGSKIYTNLGGSNVSSTISNTINSINNNQITQMISGFLSKLYFFVPREVIITILSASIAILVIRIILAIVAEVWFG